MNSWKRLEIVHHILIVFNQEFHENHWSSRPPPASSRPIAAPHPPPSWHRRGPGSRGAGGPEVASPGRGSRERGREWWVPWGTPFDRWDFQVLEIPEMTWGYPYLGINGAFLSHRETPKSSSILGFSMTETIQLLGCPHDCGSPHSEEKSGESRRYGDRTW